MVHFTMFGGHEGQLTPGRSVYINIFGGTELRRPAFAARISDTRRSGSAPSRWQHFLINLFGAIEVKWPTLAEEYLSLLDALRGGAFSLDDWDRMAGRSDSLALASAAHIGSLNLFGGIDGDALPTEDEELDSLSFQRHAGVIPPRALDQLVLAIGSRGAQRLAAVRQAVGLTLGSGARTATPQFAA
jgi:hypothetical protein